MGVRGSALWQGAILLVVAGLFGPSAGCAAASDSEAEPRLGEVASSLASEATAASEGDEASSGSPGDDGTSDPEPQPWISRSPKTGSRVPSPAPVAKPGKPGDIADEGDPEPQPWSPPGEQAVIQDSFIQDSVMQHSASPRELRSR